MAARARFSNGPNREMPRCTAVTRSGEPCRRQAAWPVGLLAHAGAPQPNATA